MSNFLLPAGRCEITCATHSSVSSNNSVASTEILQCTGALERVSAVCSSLPGTCLISKLNLSRRKRNLSMRGGKECRSLIPTVAQEACGQSLVKCVFPKQNQKISHMPRLRQELPSRSVRIVVLFRSLIEKQRQQVSTGHCLSEVVLFLDRMLKHLQRFGWSCRIVES